MLVRSHFLQLDFAKTFPFLVVFELFGVWRFTTISIQFVFIVFVVVFRLDFIFVSIVFFVAGLSHLLKVFYRTDALSVVGRTHHNGAGYFLAYLNERQTTQKVFSIKDLVVYKR